MNWREKLQEAVAEVTGAPTTATPSTIAPSAYKTGTPANPTSGTIAPSAYTSRESVVAESSAGYGLRIENKGLLGGSQDLPIQKYLTAISELRDASEVHAKAAKANGVGQNECAPFGGTGRSTEGAGCPMCGSPNQTWHDPTGRWSCSRCFMPLPSADGWPAHLCRRCRKCDWRWQSSEKRWVCGNCTSGDQISLPTGAYTRFESRPEAA
jgi:hypothetical protein